MSEVRWGSGKKINWHNPPDSNDICSLVLHDSDGDTRTYKAGFRTLCHMNKLDGLARKKFDESIRVYQPPFNTKVRASAGTHDFDAVWDLYIPGVGWWDQQRFFRQYGFGCWYRHPPTFANHIHGFTLPPHRGEDYSDDFKQAGMKVGKYVDGGLTTVGHLITSSQIRDYYNHAFGLSGQHTPGSDKSWYPSDIPATIFDLRRYVERRAA